MKKKKVVLIVIFCIVFAVAIAVGIYFAVALAPHDTSKFFDIDDNVISISFYAMIDNETYETQQFYLDSSKSDEFLSIAKNNTYQDWHNWGGSKHRPISSVLYIIEYESFYIEFGDVYYGVYDKQTNRLVSKSLIYTILSKDNFDKLYALFDAPDNIYPLGYNKARNDAV